MRFDSKKAAKKIPVKNYPAGFYKEIIRCFEYESKNQSIYGNVIHTPTWKGE